MVDDILYIETGGQRLSGWLTSSVTRGVEGMPSHFEISLSERFPTDFSKAVVIPGNTCTVFLGNDLILTGFIDEYSPSYDGRTHNVMIAGRSNAEDIVDSSFYAVDNADWHIQAGTSLQQAVQKILTNYPMVKLSFLASAANIPPPGYDIQHGESVYSAIEALARMTSKLFWDNEKGEVVISDVGTQQAGSPLVEGQNVEAAATRINWVQRFHRLLIMTEGTNSGSVYANIVAEADPDNTPGVREERIKIIVPDLWASDQSLAKKRADWEMNRRIGRSLQTQIHVVGWRDAGGQLWKPNTIVHVSLPEQKVEDDLVIAECTWSRDDQGTHTVMTCMPKAALVPEPYLARPSSGQTSIFQ